MTTNTKTANIFFIHGSDFYCGSYPHFYGKFETLSQAYKERDYWLKDRHAVYLWIAKAVLVKGKLFRDILSRMKHIENQGNLEVNEIEVSVAENGIWVEGINVNEYGGRYSNEDKQFIPKGELSNYAARSFYVF